MPTSAIWRITLPAIQLRPGYRAKIFFCVSNNRSGVVSNGAADDNAMAQLAGQQLTVCISMKANVMIDSYAFSAYHLFGESIVGAGHARELLDRGHGPLLQVTGYKFDRQLNPKYALHRTRVSQFKAGRE